MTGLATGRSRPARRWLLPGAALALALLPVAAGLALQGPEYDEAIALLTISGHTAPDWPAGPVRAGTVQAMFHDRAGPAELLADIRGSDVHPPLHYVFAWLVHLAAGPSLLLQRLASTVLLLGAWLLLLGSWRRDAAAAGIGDKSGALFTLVLLVAPASWFAATTARGYALLFLLLSLAWLLLRRLDAGAAAPLSRRMGMAAGLGLACGGALLTHYLAAPAAGLLGLAALALLLARRDLAVAALLCLAALLPVLVAGWFLLGQVEARGGYERLDFPGNLPMALRMAVSLLLRVPGEFLPPGADSAAALATALPTLAALAGLALVLRRRPGDLVALWLPLAIVVLHFAVLLAMTRQSGAPLYEPRYLTIVWPFMAILLTRGALGWGGRPGAAVALTLAATYAVHLWIALVDLPGQRFRPIVEAAERDTGRVLLIVDRGHGRGVPGAIVLAAAPETRLWIVAPDELATLPPGALPGDWDRLHVALGSRDESRLRVEAWLDALPARAPFVEHPGEIFRHRRFERVPTAGDAQDGS